MKKIFNKLPFKKVIAVFTSVTFIFTGVFGNSAFASIGTSIPAINTINIDNPIIPTSLGKITSAKYFDSDDIIINIQDLHCHAETQRKIASIIGYIDNTYNLNNVYLEGAFKTVDTSWLASFNNNKNGTKILEGLIDSGKLSGTEYYSIINNKKNFVLGIEEEDLYKENIKLLGSILSLQSDIDAICSQMEKEISKIKRDYSSRQARKLEKLIKMFKQKDIDAKHYYGQLKLLADSFNFSIDKYPNIKIYMALLENNHYINNKKVVQEFTKFVSEIKNVLPYQQYTQLLKKSNNFNNLDDISIDLIKLDKQYEITKKLKLENFKSFLVYLEFNQNINPIKLVQEEEAFINELYVKAGRTKYEKEVSFLSDFVNTIRQYFTADISADEYYKFEKNYNAFKTIWPSYFSESIIKNLDQYQRLLSKYHKNNILRDNVFATCLISKKNLNNTTFVVDTNAAIQQIKSNINKKKLKLVVTGGFHTRGLERIFEKQKISYVIITPKITQPIEQAKQIYIDNVMYYSTILKNTINLEPLTQEPLNVSFPKIMNSIFSLAQEKSIFENENIKDAIKQLVQQYIIDKQDSFYGEVDILNWDIISIDSKGQAEFYVEYKDKANKGMVSNIRYRFIDGEIISYSSIDTIRTRQMSERISLNQYAQPSLELEPTDSTREQISKYILEPLEKALKSLGKDVEKKVSLMSGKQLHMTIGYDSTPMTQQEIDEKIKRIKGILNLKEDEDTPVILTQQQTEILLKEKAPMTEIFSVIDTLGENFVNFKTTMSGTLKLMPDGVIIYEITDKNLIERMLQFRIGLKDVNLKYKTPSIVHMTIGRISDPDLLDGSEQSKQELAEILKKINETIHEINKKKALAKIKTTFTLKAGYVSSTGDKDFVVRRILPKKETLNILKNFTTKTKLKFNNIYEIIIAPVVEETLFRLAPFFIASSFITNPVSIVPAIVTVIIGIFGFSFAHPLMDRLNNFIVKKVEDGTIKNDFLSELFDKKLPVRDVKNFLIPSIILTTVYIAVSFLVPQSAFIAFAVTTIIHSVYNFIIGLLNKDKLTVIQSSSSKDKNLDSEINQIIETLKSIARNKALGYRKERNDFIDDFENVGGNKESITQKVTELFDFVVQNQKKQNCFDFIYLLEPILDISAYLKDKQGNILFDEVLKYIFEQAKQSESSRYHEMLMDSAKYFYKEGQMDCVHKIIDSLYKNKPFVKSLRDYQLFALPLPSPFSFSSVTEWENEIFKIINEDNLYSNWYIPMLEIFVSSFSTEHKLDEYAKAYIRVLYKSGKQKEAPRIKYLNEYEWNKAFCEACGIKQENDEDDIPESEPLLDKENIKLFADNAEILQTNNLYLSDIVLRLKNLRQFVPSNETLNSTQYLQIIDKLTAALSLPKQKQMEVITEQMNELVNLFIEQKCLEDEKILETLTPILIFVKSNKTSQSLISLIPVKYKWGEIVNEEALCKVVSFIYNINRQEALSLINKIYSQTQKINMFGINWEQWRPKNLQEAYEKVPTHLKNVIKKYEDLELFYYTLGIEFDSIENDSLLYDRREYIPEYQLLLNKLPVSVFQPKQQTKKYFRTLKKEILSTQGSSEDSEKLALYFEALEKVLDNNILALSEINKANKDAMDDAFLFVEEMINNFDVLNETVATKARISLEKIKEKFYSNEITVSDLVKLKPWDVKHMDSITELHTLINAVHQTAINNLMSKLKYSKLGSQCVFKENDEEHFSFFDCSTTKISKQMEDFIAYLKLGFFLSKGIKVVVKDNKLVYSKSLGAHSVDVMVDLNEGIRVTFNDSGRGDGNAMRVLLLSSLFAQAGFDITNLDAKTDINEGICSFTAMCSLPKGALNNGIEYAKYFEQALNILSDTKDLDFRLEGRDEDGDSHSYGEYIIPDYNLERINKLKNSTNIPEEFTFSNMPQERFKEKQKNNPARNKILSPVLGRQWTVMSEMLTNLKKRIEQSGNDLDAVYDYLSIEGKSKKSVWEIVSEYVKGKLVIEEDEKGNKILKRKTDYDGISGLLKAIEKNVDDSSRQAQVINLLDHNDLNFETEGYIGGMVALSGVLRLDGEGWLSIKTVVDKERKRSKFAYVEFVDFEGVRTPLHYKDLIKKLREFGYTVKEQKPRGRSEIKESLVVLKEKILYPKDGIYTRGMSVSGQSDRYIPVRVTYDKSKVSDNSMWIVSYTTPEDVATIINAGAIMTTTGGMLSHANITARENKKTAILSNGQWIEGKLEVPYYYISPESEIKQRGKYETQIISEKRIVLEEGAVVLANGMNGRVLVYDKISKQTISDIQKAIDDNDVYFIMEYIQNHYSDDNIRQIVEYIFLQVITDKKKEDITRFLLAWDKDSEIGAKVYELTDVYISEKIKALKIYVRNERKIKDARIRFSIINFIEQELDVLPYSYVQEEKWIYELEQLASDVYTDKKDIVLEISAETKKVIKNMKQILGGSSISERDKDELLKISEVAKVWNFYGSSQIRDLVREIDKLISLESGINYETEIRDFEDIMAKDVVRYGTKTTELAKISKFFKDKKINIAKVPHGIGMSKDVLRIFFEHNGLLKEYLELMSAFQYAIKNGDKDEALKIGKQISKYIENLDDKQLEEFLKSKLEDGKNYAVRSSGVGEDGENHAFAGMAKTELNINKGNVYATVKEGWKSFFTDTCIEDMVKVGIVVQPALLIQEMVTDVKKAGVMFTRDTSGNLTLEAVLGLGEGLVSGRITPDHITVRTFDGRIEYRRALNNMIKIEEKEQGGTRVAKLTKEEKIERILDEDTIKQLQKTARILEKDAGYPVDIEFAIDKDGKIFVLQRRAITTFTTFTIQEESNLQTAKVPVIEQALIDKTIKLLSYWDMKEIKDVIDKLSDLPKDESERYNAIVKEIYNLIDILKKGHRIEYRPGGSSSYNLSKNIYDDEFGKLCMENDMIASTWDKKVYFSTFLIYTLLPFLNIKDIKNSEEPLFNSIVDYWLIEKQDRGGVAVGEMATLMKFSYSINSDFIPYIVRKLTERRYILPEGKIDGDINSELKTHYDALKQYYFAVSAREKKDEILSKELNNIVVNLKDKLIPLIMNEEQQKQLILTLLRIEELSSRVNDKNIALLQILVNDLWEIILKEDKQNMEKYVIYILPLFICLAKAGDKLEEDIIFENQIKTVVDMLKSSYDVHSDNKIFNYILDGLIGISKQFYNLNNKNSAKICEDIIKTVILTVYAPVSNGTIDKNSLEYKERERDFYAIFNKLNSEFPNLLGFFSYLFAKNAVRNPESKRSYYISDDENEDAFIFGPGLNNKTFQMYINTVRKSNKRNVFVPVPKRDSDIRDINELASSFSDNYELFDLSTFCKNLFEKEENGNAHKLAVNIIKHLLEKMESKDIEFKEKQKILFILINMATSELYMSAQKYNFFDVEKLNDWCRKYKLPYYLKSVTDSYVKFENRRSTKGEYRLTHLLKYLPKNIFSSISDIVQEPPILYTINGETKNNDERVEQIKNKFNTLRQILDDNTLALSLLNGLSKSKTPEKNMEELIDVLYGMIKGLSLINEKHGIAAQTALDNIVKDLNLQSSNKIVSLDVSRIERQVAIKQWDEDKLSEITEIHTLINAVHQISISDFKDTIEDITGSKSIKTIVATHQNSEYDSDYSTQTGVEIYDLSEKELNPDIIDFIGRLSQMYLPYPRYFKDSKPKYQISDFICKDNFLVWTTRLYVHSVDMFMNFAESDKTITISYHEGGRSFGNAQRVKYFSAVLEQLGFSVKADTKEGPEGVCGLKASLSSNYELNDNADFVDIATKVVSLFKYSDMLDFDLFDYGDDDGQYSSGSGYATIFEDFVKKFMRGDIWFGYNPTGRNGWGRYLTSLPERRSLSGKREEFKSILRYLGLPENLPLDNNQNNLNNYFNAVIERAFAVGRIIIDKAGNFIKNENYDIVSYLAKEISLNEEEVINESRLINLIPRNKFKFKTVGYMGDFIAISGYLKLEDGNYLSVKGLANPVTKRMKYAVTELVSPELRTKVNSNDLITILQRQGYIIPKQEWVGSRERKRIKNMLLRPVQIIQSPKIPSTPTSDGTGVSVVGNITFDKNKVDRNSILVVPYTTPNDIQVIETAKGIITTGGGVLSHAAITTRELKKPSVVLNDATWINREKEEKTEIEILYYLASGEPEIIDNQFQVQKVEETREILKEGDRVLINGETGTVLLFNDIDVSMLDELQDYIDTDNAQAVMDFMNNLSQNENINRFVEYVYFQVIGNSKTTQILDCLFSDDMSIIVQDKVKELNDSYIQDKIQSVSEAIENLKTINNINIAYMVLQELNKKLAFIKTIGTRSEIESLKQQLKYIEKGIKTKLNLYMQTFINDAVELLNKDKLSNVDIQKMITMLKNVEIYNYFVSDNETEEDLLSKKDSLRILVPMLRDKVNGYNEQQQEIMLQDEISLFEEKADNEKLFGSKTSQLAKMFKLLKGRTGITVPGGIGISVNVMPMLFKSLGKEKLLTEFENAIKNKDKQRAIEIAKNICDLIDLEELKGTELEQEIIKQLQKFIKPGQNYSVRSSGVGEDATNNAFAGMGETKLNIDYDNIYDNVRECWKSFFAERCIDYMISSGQIVKPAVLVEEMVDSEISGVVFSRDKYGNGRINALFGQGEGLVSGMFTPDSVLFDMNSGEIIEYSVADKQFKLVTDAEGGLRKIAVGQNVKSRALSAQNVKKLAEIISRLENSVGYPIDVEFAIRDNEIYILQMRPITTLDNKKNEEKITEETLHMQEILPVETRYEISVTVGEISKTQEVFAYIANPLEPTQAIPIYKKSADKNVTEFIVDSKYAFVVKSGILGRALIDRINTDPVILTKLNDGIFNFKPGEIALLPILDDDSIERALSENTINIGIGNIRNILASA